MGTGASWQRVFAALGNRAQREAFAELVRGTYAPGGRAPTGFELKALGAWESLGLAVADGGGWVFDGAPLRAALDAARPARPTGVGRFLKDGRITAWPSAPADRRALMLWVRDRCVSPGETLPEAEVSDRITRFHPDHALIRRYLVDHGLLARHPDGTGYTLPEE